jgi:hypothetical protein
MRKRRRLSRGRWSSIEGAGAVFTLTIPVERISERARRHVDLRGGLRVVVRLLASVLLGMPYVLGWSVRALWLGLTMLYVAAAEGWRDAGRSRAAKGARR